MIASILSIGDELVLGQTLDTNSAWIAARLSAVGCDIKRHQTVGDDQQLIVRSLRELSADVDLLIVSGGIGPTEDDLTRQSLAEVLGQPLEQSTFWMERLESFFKKRGRPMPPINAIQAMIPRGAELIDNAFGTAAAIRATLGKCTVFIVPGVPKEMKGIYEQFIAPFVASRAGGHVILQKKLNTFGLGESAVAEKLGDLMTRGRNPSVGTTVSAGLVSLRVNARFDTLEIGQRELKETVDICRERLGDLIFSEDDTSLAQIVADLMLAKKVQVTTAESCTGGLLAKMLTDIPGSSTYFKTGFITYANQSKYERLGINMEILNVYGAVSEPVVEAMARNALRLSKANVALSISGVAGPGGGSETKPVGTVCIAIAHLAGRDDVRCTPRTFSFPGDREMVRDRSAKMALAMLRYWLLGKDMPF